VINANLDFNRGRDLLELLGSFWARSYEGRDQVQVYCEAVGRAVEQVYQDLLEMIEGLARRDIPLFHTERWHMLVLRQSDRGTDAVGQLRFGDPDHPRTFGQGAVFGVPTDFGEFANPAGGIVDCRLICNRLTEPTRTLIAGVDYQIDIDRDLILFRDDPFTDALVPSEPIVDAHGAEIDRQVTLWCYRAQFDRESLYYHYGHPLGLHRPSSQRYKDLVNALWDAMTGATCRADLDGALSAMADADLASGDGEVVQVVDTTGPSLVVITDRKAYRFSPAATVLVKVGDVLAAGDPLIDAVQVSEIGHGAPPAWLTELAIGPEFTGGRTVSDLIFEDREVPLTVHTDWSGLTRAEFPLAGMPADQDAFWEEVWRRSLDTGETLAQALQLNPTAGQPTAANLPATVNPLRFAVANLFQNNVFLVRLKVASFGPAALGANYLSVLRRVIPPHTALISLVEMPTLGESDRLGSTGPVTQQMTPFTDGLALTASDGPTGLRTVAEACA